MTDLEIEAAGIADAGVADPARRTFWGDAWRILRRRVLFWVAAFLIVVFAMMAVVPQLFLWPAPGESDPGGQHCFLSNAREQPSSEHWFGTDKQGCDYLTQVVYGTRVSMRIALGATLVVLAFGLVLGGLAGYFSGVVDTLISRIADGFFALPYIVGAIIVLSAVAGQRGREEWHILLAIAFLSWPALTRLYRSSVLQVKNLEYVQAARALGASDTRVLLRHVFPNAIAPVIVYSTVSMGAIISIEATLSFLGVGLPPGTASWGLQVEGATDAAQAGNDLYLLFFPSTFLILASLGFVMMGEQLREAFDPRFR